MQVFPAATISDHKGRSSERVEGVLTWITEEQDLKGTPAKAVIHVVGHSHVGRTVNGSEVMTFHRLIL